MAEWPASTSPWHVEDLPRLVVAGRDGQTEIVHRASPPSSPPLPPVPADEVDVSLLDWYLQLTVCERLRAASASAATLERLARAATRDR
ncbi:MAG: hypothetical protein IPL61_36810 [Myxococcales bacterium]|nr:hypothetical protein [Myxococcales bacterium]